MKDYYSKKINNPFLKKKNTEKKKKTLLCFFIILLMLGIFCFITYTKYLNIKNIEVTGHNKTQIIEDIKKIAKKQSKNLKFKILPQKNILFFDTNLLRKTIKNKYHFQNIEIKKNILKFKISINIRENNTLFIIKESSNITNNYYIDNQNYVIKVSTSTLDSKYPIIIDKTNNLIKDDQVLLNKKYLNRVASFFDLFYLTSEQKIDINGFVVDNELIDLNNFGKNMLKISIKNGPIITFGNKKPIEEIHELILIKNKLGDDFYKQKYINMMYGDKIFSK